MSLIPRVHDHVDGLIRRFAMFQSAGQAVELTQAIYSSVYLVKEIVEMIKMHESYMGRSDAVAQCMKAVGDLCDHALKAVKVPYVPSLVGPILNQFVKHVLVAVTTPVAEILFDRMQILPPAPAPVPGTGSPLGSVPTGSTGAAG